MVLKEIGERVRLARTGKGLTQAQLAGMLKLSPHFVSNIELGKQSMSVTTLSAICEALDVSADWILWNNTPEARVMTGGEVARKLKNCSVTERSAMLKILNNLEQIIRCADRSDS